MRSAVWAALLLIAAVCCMHNDSSFDIQETFGDAFGTPDASEVADLPPKLTPKLRSDSKEVGLQDLAHVHLDGKPLLLTRDVVNGPPSSRRTHPRKRQQFRCRTIMVSRNERLHESIVQEESELLSWSTGTEPVNLVAKIVSVVATLLSVPVRFGYGVIFLASLSKHGMPKRIVNWDNVGYALIKALATAAASAVHVMAADSTEVNNRIISPLSAQSPHTVEWHDLGIQFSYGCLSILTFSLRHLQRPKERKIDTTFHHTDHISAASHFMAYHLSCPTPRSVTYITSPPMCRRRCLHGIASQELHVRHRTNAPPPWILSSMNRCA